MSLTDNATKYCTENGTWWVNPNTHKQWTNFTTCISSAPPTSHPPSVPDMIIKHFESVRLMYNIGYGLSLVSLIIACAIMLYFKKLHCPRNTIHLNLFLSFILRAAISFVKENLLVEYVGFPIDVYYDDHHKLIFRSDMLHWECKLFFTLLNYIIAANYLWILVEAVYLQMLITVSVFVEKSRIKWYILFGWCFPLVSIIPWVIVRAVLYNEYCWNLSYVNEYIIHIIYGPITVSVFIQFIIFINIVRILFTKLNASPCPETKKFRYRRLAKSTLILIPLFGVYYIIFAVKDFNLIDENSYAYVVLWWAEFFFNSFQYDLTHKLSCNLHFCLFDCKVQAEFKKRWKRYMIRREGSGRTLKSLLQSRSHRHQNGTRTTQQNGVVDNTCFRGQNGVRSSLSYKETVHKTEDIDQNNDELSERTPCMNNNDDNDIIQTELVEHASEIRT
ncbi:hypothetical protein FSP39_014500 [Pinctada imbricata]|uniref:G-protein coupled receptors family 2 profile 2 domain-containing protein n=1 Tax=Pinctada imbricata TaxID=66713 RepID=A0AA88YRA8_PINIB|nr:hypothetical protein FSP39_014500 [Pinctada imbricata]